MALLCTFDKQLVDPRPGGVLVASSVINPIHVDHAVSIDSAKFLYLS